jgi:hypothetical protein
VRPLDEQPNRAVPQRVLAIRDIFCRHSERRHRVNPLALRSQWLATGSNHPRSRVRTQQRFSHFCYGVDHMLAIVEHEHELLRAERIRNTFGRYRTAGEIDAEGCCHGGRDKLGIGQGCQLRDPSPVDKSR